jgi:hypothetical protein
MPLKFRWTKFDLTNRLPDGWQQAIAATADHADFHDFPRTPILSRESKHVKHVARGRVHAIPVRRNLPWLYEFYRGYFLELAGKACAETVMPARDDRYGIVLNVQRGTAIRPQAGHLIFFDGRRYPHYARPLASKSGTRIVAVMNFYTESCPESTRPPELNRHLFGRALSP